jgi:hypothetical protein
VRDHAGPAGRRVQPAHLLTTCAGPCFAGLIQQGWDYIIVLLLLVLLTLLVVQRHAACQMLLQAPVNALYVVETHTPLPPPDPHPSIHHRRNRTLQWCDVPSINNKPFKTLFSPYSNKSKTTRPLRHQCQVQDDKGTPHDQRLLTHKPSGDRL